MKRIKAQLIYLISLLVAMMIISGVAYAEDDIPMLENPMTVQYLKKNLRKSQPRLVLNSKIEKNLKKKLKTDPVIQNMFKAIQLKSISIGHGVSPFEVNIQKEGGITNLLIKKRKQPSMFGGKGYVCPEGHELISMITWRT